MTSKILLLDYDHTLYPPSLPTQNAVDERINLYIRDFLGFSPEAADALRSRLCDEYGATLKGLELHHGVEREHYCDFIHDIEEGLLPVPDPALERWLESLSHPVYLFTNARLDWAVRGLRAMGLDGFLPSALRGAGDFGQPAAAGKFRDVFDIDFMDWLGKPHPDAYAKVENHLRGLHGDGIRIYFADDKPANLLAARARDWSTIWIRPDDADGAEWKGAFDAAVPSLVHLDPLRLA